VTAGRRTIPRLLLLTAAFVATAIIVHNRKSDRQVVPSEPLRAFPLHIGPWAGRQAETLDDRVVRVLGADDYLSRVYTAGTTAPVDLFIGFYGSQRTGAVIHSPLNCLPGAGWQPVSRRRLQMNVAGRQGISRRVEVNEVLVQQGEDRQLAIYWYQERGRVVASEYTSRALMVLDAIRSGRTDGALVRVMTPAGLDASQDDDARLRLRNFVETVFATLDGYLPA
jgi:EpsI family protein